uniref:NACHT domain-containing protein n=1 Tax=Latimeria chalumnae TaxID=7897 RepID=H3AZ93_LATCH
SKRMLLVGNAGMGKSCISKEFLRTWAEGKNDHYRCIIYLTFQELNLIEQEISVKELLEEKCEFLFSVLTLENPDDLLIILDGLDEFKYDLNFDNQSSRNDVDTPFPISVLISKLITKDLLPAINVMVTTRWNFVSNLEKYFTFVCVIKGFDDQQIKQYFDHFCEDQSESIYDFIKKNNLSDFASVPLYSFMLRQIIKNHVTSKKALKNLKTSSRFMIQFLKSCLGNNVKDRRRFHIKEPATEKNMEDSVRQLGEISYKNLLSGQLTVNANDLKKHGLSEKDLTKKFSCFFHKKHPDGKHFEYRHTMIKEMFAAFYCAHVVRDDELKECLDAWVRGIIPPSAKSKLLSDVTADHKLLLENFTRLFMGFLSIGNSSSLHDDRGTLKGPIKKNLIEWFQDWLQEDLSSDDFLNLLHYVFELQDSDVAQSVSVYIKNIILFNKPLGAIDVQALCFSLKENKLEKLNLTLCELGDKGMEQLRDIITNSITRNLLRWCLLVGFFCIKLSSAFKPRSLCTSVEIRLSSNKLSEKGGATLSEILQDPKCAIEKLIIGTNHLGPVGAKHLWKALEKNSILKTLHVYDNDIEDEGTATMVE